ncbi:CHAT domain-containing protein [Streptomyces sp. NBC_00073]|uniref:CHAT domain-containing protein n=1 Tax=Streptomyces sp. NBC_00073 TaxID=2975640 RepID=UPI00324A070D
MSVFDFLFGLLPMLLGTAATAHGAGVAVLFTSLFLSGAMWWEFSSLRNLTPLGRSSGRLNLILTSAAMLLVSRTGIGSWLAESGLPAVIDSGGIELACGITAIGWFMGEMRELVAALLTPRRLLPLRLAVQSATTLCVVARGLTGRGHLVFYAAALAHPASSVSHLALALAATECVLSFCSAKPLMGARRREFDLRYVKKAKEPGRREVLTRWAELLLQDPQCTRGARFINDCMLKATTALRLREIKGNAAFGGGGQPAYEEWLDLSEQAVNTLIEESGRHTLSPLAEHAVGELHAQWASRASLDQFLFQRGDEAVRLLRIAIAQFTRVGMINTAAMEGLSLVQLLLTQEVDRPEEAQDVLAAIRTDTRLAPAVLRDAHESYVQLLLRQGQVEAARIFWESARHDGAPGESMTATLLAESYVRSPAYGGITKRIIDWFERQARACSESDIARQLADPDGAARRTTELSDEELDFYRTIHLGAAADTADAEALIERYTPEARGLTRLVMRVVVKRRLVRAGRRTELKKELPFALRCLMAGRGLDWMWALDITVDDFHRLGDAGRPEQAEALLAKAVTNFSPQAVRWFEFPSRVSRAALAIQRNDRPAAYRLLLEAFAISEHERLRIRDSTYRTQSEIKDVAFETAVNLLSEDLDTREVHAHPAAEALRVSELSRSRILLDLLHESEDDTAEERGDEVFSPLGYARIRALLPSDRSAAFAQFFIGHTHATVFVGRREYAEPAVVRFPLTETEFGLLTRRGKAGDESAEAAVEELAARMLSALLSHLEPGALLWLIPHRRLHYLPLHAVTLSDGGTLAARHPVFCTPSASVLHFCGRRGSGAYRSVLTLADTVADRPLAHARAEAAAVAALFDEAVGRTGEDATREQVTELLRAGSFDVVHIATHGSFDSERALDSGVDLAGGARLTARDILDLRLDTRLVVLSSCESGLGEQRGGDELFGLTRALLYAGVRSVLVTLWKVDDASTGLLMQCFYRYLLGGMPAAEALSAAQRALAGATAAEVIAACERMRRAVADPAAARSLDRELADLYVRAGDHRAALQALGRARASLAPDDPEAIALSRLAARCEARARRSPAPAAASASAHARHLYADPYYWAPFVLIGDWH